MGIGVLLDLGNPEEPFGVPRAHVGQDVSLGFLGEDLHPLDGALKAELGVDAPVVCRHQLTIDLGRDSPDVLLEGRDLPLFQIVRATTLASNLQELLVVRDVGTAASQNW